MALANQLVGYSVETMDACYKTSYRLVMKPSICILKINTSDIYQSFLYFDTTTQLNGQNE